ncbi:hypothetical protein L9F63_011992, partial [Diploptera punctata]
MFNLNVNVSTSASSGSNTNLLGVESSCTTPKTPEILNSLIAMTNPFDGFVRNVPRLASCPPGGSENSSSSGGSPLGSPSGNSPPSVQHTCSQLIKEGLKLTIQTKRRNTGQNLDCLDSPRSSKMAKREEVSDYDGLFSPGVGLTAEDEERRRRRRERNKIAATKCRLKKRERTVNLVQESEILENQNQDLKTQIQELETQRRRLMDMLSMHSPTCMKNVNNIPYSPDTSATFCGDSTTSIAAAFCNDTTTTTTSSGGYSHYSGGYTDNAFSKNVLFKLWCSPYFFRYEFIILNKKLPFMCLTMVCKPSVCPAIADDTNPLHTYAISCNGAAFEHAAYVGIQGRLDRKNIGRKTTEDFRSLSPSSVASGRP